jgi:hypothetical protein
MQHAKPCARGVADDSTARDTMRVSGAYSTVPGGFWA